MTEFETKKKWESRRGRVARATQKKGPARRRTLNSFFWTPARVGWATALRLQAAADCAFAKAASTGLKASFISDA